MESISSALGPASYTDGICVSSPGLPGGSSPSQTSQANVESESSALGSDPNADGIYATAHGTSSRSATQYCRLQHRSNDNSPPIQRESGPQHCSAIYHVCDHVGGGGGAPLNNMDRKLPEKKGKPLFLVKTRVCSVL